MEVICQLAVRGEGVKFPSYCFEIKLRIASIRRIERVQNGQTKEDQSLSKRLRVAEEWTDDIDLLPIA